MDYFDTTAQSSDEDKGAYNPDNNNNPQQGGDMAEEADPFVAAPAEYAHRLVPMTPWQMQDDEDGSIFAGSGMWAIGNSVDLLITIDGENCLLRTPKLHEQPLPQAAQGNMLLGGLTTVYRTDGGGIEQTTIRITQILNPAMMDGVKGVAHTEFQYFLGLMGLAAELVSIPATLAVIFEVHQTNTPCATCQKLIMYNVSLFCANSGKLAAFRGTAEQVYESSAGDLGRALLAVRAGGLALDQQGPAHIANVYGVHGLVGVPAAALARSSKRSGSNR